MSRRLLVGLLLALLVVACAGATWSQPHHHTKRRGCKTRGEYTVVANSRARVFFANRDPDDDGEVYACLYGQQRDRRLSTTVIDTAGRGGEFFQLSDPFGRHEFVAFTQEECGADCSYTAKTIDLDSGRRVRRAYGHEAISLLLVGGGSLAILDQLSYPWESPTIYSVKKVEATGTTVLDQGPDIDPQSLAVSGHWVYWRRGGTTRSAPIH